MDDKERREWLEHWRAFASRAGVSDEHISDVLDTAEGRLSSFKDLCAAPFGRTEIDLDKDYPEEESAGALTQIEVPCFFFEGQSRGLFSVNAEYLFGQAVGVQAEGLVAEKGYASLGEFLSLKAAGDERASHVYHVLARYFLRPAHLYVLLRLSGKIEEAVRELANEANAAVLMHLFPEDLPAEHGRFKFPPATQPSSWAETVRQEGYDATRRRLEPFATSQSKPSSDSFLGRAIANFRTALERQLGGPVDERTFASHLTVKALVEYSGVSRSTFKRRFKESIFRGDIEELKRSFTGE